MFRFNSPRLALALALSLAGIVGTPPIAIAQEGILSSRITLASSEASIHLTFPGDRELDIAFRDGSIFVDGDEVGRHSEGGALVTSWRALLGRAMTSAEEDLPELLLGWTPPGDPEAGPTEVEELLREELDRSLEGFAPSPPPTIQTGIDPGAVSALQSLLTRPDRVRQLAIVVGELSPERTQIRMGDTVRIVEGDTLPEGLLALDAAVHLEGVVDGDVFLLGGEIDLGPESRVTGRLRWADARVLGNRDAVALGITEIAPPSDLSVPATIETTPARPPESPREATRTDRRRGADAAVDHLGGAFLGIARTFLTFLLLLVGGFALLHLVPGHLDLVARTARRSPGRSTLVGLAGLVLAFPIWIVGTVSLAVSILGIPLLLAWVPLFPLLAFLAIALGYLAIALNLGRWAAALDHPWARRWEGSPPSTQIGLGLAILLGLFALASALRIGGPWFGFFEGALQFTAIVLTSFAICVGLGSVILSKAGRSPAFAGPEGVPTSAPDRPLDDSAPSSSGEDVSGDEELRDE